MKLGFTSSAGFHHISTKMTLLQAVRFRPEYKVRPIAFGIVEG